MKKELKVENTEELEELDENIEEQEEKEEKTKKKKKKWGRIIANIFITLLFLVIIFESAIGIVNMQRINNDKDAVWYINKKDNSTKNKKEVIYNLGLYKIVRTDTSKKTKIALKPFFVAD